MKISKAMLEKLKTVDPEVINRALAEVAPVGELDSAVAKFHEFFEEFGKKFQNRAQEIEQIKAALLLNEHMLLTGKPGTGKSQLARTLFHHITTAEGGRAKVFEIQFSKFMSEDYVFGPINIKKMREEGIIEHVTDGSIVDADFAFIDEVFDGSDVLVRSLLEILNERTFTRGKQQVKCNLHTAIMTTNWNRDEESTEAFLDRILFRSEVKPLATVNDRMRMYKNYLGNNGNGVIPMDTTLPLDIIRQLSEALKQVTVDTESLKYYDSVMREFIKQTGVYVSDRTSNKALNLLRMKALLEYRDYVTPEDIIVVKCALFGRETQEASVKPDEVFNLVYEKQVVEGRVEATEMARLKPFLNPVHRLREVVYDADREKNILRLAEAESKEIESMEKEYETLQTQKAKKLVEEMIDSLKEDIQKAKNELMSNTIGGKPKEVEVCE